jgi:hypothetical protein
MLNYLNVRAISSGNTAISSGWTDWVRMAQPYIMVPHHHRIDMTDVSVRWRRIGTASFPSSAEPGLDSIEGNRLHARLFHMRCDSAKRRGFLNGRRQSVPALCASRACASIWVRTIVRLSGSPRSVHYMPSKLGILPCSGEQDHSNPSSPQRASSLSDEAGQDLPSRSISIPIDYIRVLHVVSRVVFEIQRPRCSIHEGR